MRLAIALGTRAAMVAASYLWARSDDPLSAGLPLLAMIVLAVPAFLAGRSPAHGPALNRIFAALDMLSVALIPFLLLFGDWEAWPRPERLAVALACFALPAHILASIPSGKART